VTEAHHPVEDVLAALDPLADQEEGRFSAVLFEEIEYSRCVVWRRSVVEGQGDGRCLRGPFSDEAWAADRR
jgi:hypothetical protein